MNTRTTSKSALFLMELILAIFFFSLASAVCIQLFVKAHLLGADTTNKNHGVMWAQNIAEVYLGNDADIAATIDTLQAVSNGSDSFSLYFDQDWNACAVQDARYGAVVQVAETIQMNTAHIAIREINDSVSPDNRAAVSSEMDTDDSAESVIYELSVSKHLPLTAK